MGFLEHADTRFVVGWAYDSESPSAHLEITVRVGDEFCASGFANIQRSDLLAAGIGGGGHGFRIDLSEAQISTEAVAALEVHAISGVEIIQLSLMQANSDAVIDLVSKHHSPIIDEHQFPVFILGPARSGTSVVTLALLESASYIGTGEGHLLPLAHVLLGAIDQYYRARQIDPNTMLGRVPVDAFQKLIRRGFIDLAVTLFPSARWLDKTPTVEMVRAAPLMKELWPNARFIFMKRRVIENVLSRRKKFPEDTTDRHYSDWVAVMTAWLAVRQSLGDAALEVEHHQLVLEPDAVASSIANFLSLPEAAASCFGHYINNSHPEQTDQNFGAIHTFKDLALNETETAQMLTACDPIMNAFGYSYSESYFN